MKLAAFVFMSMVVYGFWPETQTYEVTAYCPCELCCGAYSDGITASGVPLDSCIPKFCAAPPEVPYGTLVEIPGYGEAPVLDRGGAITLGRLDVFFWTHEEALAWGRQTLKVKFHD